MQYLSNSQDGCTLRSKELVLYRNNKLVPMSTIDNMISTGHKLVHQAKVSVGPGSPEIAQEENIFRKMSEISRMSEVSRDQNVQTKTKRKSYLNVTFRQKVTVQMTVQMREKLLLAGTSLFRIL